MRRLVDALIAAVYSVLVLWGGYHPVQFISEWVQKTALEIASQNLGSMEEMTQTMTGGRLDF